MSVGKGRELGSHRHAQTASDNDHSDRPRPMGNPNVRKHLQRNLLMKDGRAVGEIKKGYQ